MSDNRFSQMAKLVIEGVPLSVAKEITDKNITRDPIAVVVRVSELIVLFK